MPSTKPPVGGTVRPDVQSGSLAANERAEPEGTSLSAGQRDHFQSEPPSSGIVAQSTQSTRAAALFGEQPPKHPQFATPLPGGVETLLDGKLPEDPERRPPAPSPADRHGRW